MECLNNESVVKMKLKSATQLLLEMKLKNYYVIITIRGNRLGAYYVDQNIFKQQTSQLSPGIRGDRKGPCILLWGNRRKIYTKSVKIFYSHFSYRQRQIRCHVSLPENSLPVNDVRERYYFTIHELTIFPLEIWFY